MRAPTATAQHQNYTRVAVIMPAYNAAQYLEETVDSLLAQTFHDFVLLIIDDGSTDKTPLLLTRLAKKDSRIRVHTQKNQGLVKTLNRYMFNQPYEYIARADSDDLFSPNRLEKQIAYLDTHPECGGVGSLAQNIDESGVRGDIHSQPSSYSSLALYCGYGCPMAGANVTYRKACLNEMKSIDSKFYPAEDHHLMSRILLTKHWKLYSIPEVLYFYRQTTTGISLSNKDWQEEIKQSVCTNYRKQAQRISLFPYAGSQIARTWAMDCKKMPSEHISNILAHYYCDIVALYLADERINHKVSAAYHSLLLKRNVASLFPTLRDTLKRKVV